MSGREAPAGQPVGAFASARTRLSRIVADLGARVPRLFLLSQLSIVTGTIVLVAKASLLLVAPTWFLVANITFAAGVLIAKSFILAMARADRGLPSEERRQRGLSVYAWTGRAIIALAAVYIAASVPSVLGEPITHVDLPTAILIGAIAFTELVVCIVGLIAGRNDGDPTASALRRLNLSSAVVLIALTQAALISATAPTVATPSGIAGIAFGFLVLLIGVGAVARSRTAARRPLDPSTTANAADAPVLLDDVTPDRA